MAAKVNGHKLSEKDTASGRAIVWKCRLRDMRHDLRLTLRDVSEACGISIAVLSAVERGTEPMLTTARKIAAFFGSTVEEIWPELPR